MSALLAVAEIFSRPNSKQLEPRIAYHHPLLDEKFGIDPLDTSLVWTDGELERLIDRYVAAAGLARQLPPQKLGHVHQVAQATPVGR